MSSPSWKVGARTATGQPGRRGGARAAQRSVAPSWLLWRGVEPRISKRADVNCSPRLKGGGPSTESVAQLSTSQFANRGQDAERDKEISAVLVSFMPRPSLESLPASWTSLRILTSYDIKRHPCVADWDRGISSFFLSAAQRQLNLGIR